MLYMPPYMLVHQLNVALHHCLLPIGYLSLRGMVVVEPSSVVAICFAYMSEWSGSFGSIPCRCNTFLSST